MIKILISMLFIAAPLGAITPVIMPNGTKLPYKMEDGVKVFHLIAEPVKREFSPGIIFNCWGYNGSTPGPMIEATEGDRVRIIVTNNLPEPTTIHWHGIRVPSNMDGVSGLSQKAISPHETFTYEFTLKQSGTFMYHPHYDEMTQMGMGMMGLFIIHPKKEEGPPVQKDFAIMLAEWYVPIGATTPDPMVMEFNYFTFNSTIYPQTEPLVVKKGDRVRIRFGNLSMDSHPIHLHGFEFYITRTGAKRIPESAQWTDVTIDVPVGSTRDIEFVADTVGDWALHCHKTHHTMSGMKHGLPNMLGIKLEKSQEEKLQKLFPGYMPMGETGMGEMSNPHHASMPRPANFPSYSNPGPYGPIDMTGMFTILRVEE